MAWKTFCKDVPVATRVGRFALHISIFACTLGGSCLSLCPLPQMTPLTRPSRLAWQDGLRDRRRVTHHRTNRTGRRTTLLIKIKSRVTAKPYCHNNTFTLVQTQTRTFNRWITFVCFAAGHCGKSTVTRIVSSRHKNTQPTPFLGALLPQNNLCGCSDVFRNLKRGVPGVHSRCWCTLSNCWKFSIFLALNISTKNFHLQRGEKQGPQNTPLFGWATVDRNVNTASPNFLIPQVFGPRIILTRRPRWRAAPKSAKKSWTFRYLQQLRMYYGVWTRKGCAQ